MIIEQQCLTKGREKVFVRVYLEIQKINGLRNHVFTDQNFKFVSEFK